MGSFSRILIDFLFFFLFAAKVLTCITIEIHSSVNNLNGTPNYMFVKTMHISRFKFPLTFLPKKKKSIDMK